MIINDKTEIANQILIKLIDLDLIKTEDFSKPSEAYMAVKNIIKSVIDKPNEDYIREHEIEK